MMISPEIFIAKYADRSYSELISIRDELINRIYRFEKQKVKTLNEIIIHRSPEVIYQCNLLYLAKLCALISENIRGIHKETSPRSYYLA